MDAYKSSMEPTDVMFGIQTPLNSKPSVPLTLCYRQLQEAFQSLTLSD